MHDIGRWDDVRVFLACVRGESFSAAARALGVEQSTVSRRIKALERAMGGALFKRTPEGVLLTALATRVLEQAKAVESSMSALMVRSRQEQEMPEGVVRLALTESMSVHWLLPLLEMELERWPLALRLELVSGVVSSDLVRGEADIALRFVRPSKGNLVMRRVAQMGFAVMAHPDYMHAHRNVSWQAHRWVSLRLPFEGVPEQDWYARHIESPPWLSFNNYMGMMEAVRRAMGIGLMTRSVMKAFPELVEVQTPFEMPEPLDLWLVTHADLRHSPAVAHVWTLLERWVQML